MQRHEIQLSLTSDAKQLAPAVAGSRVINVNMKNVAGDLKFGLGQIIDQLAERGLRPSDVAIDLLILAVAVQIADTRILRTLNAQDSWTREIDLTVPVADTALWTTSAPLIERMLRFLSGDIWSVRFTERAANSIAAKKVALPVDGEFNQVSLFSGGMDSYLGAIEDLTNGRRPLFVSHYWDLGTSSQAACANHLGNTFGDLARRHLRVRVGAVKNDVIADGDSQHENSQRARSFVFFSLAAVAASSLGKSVTISVPENGLISLNVPLDVHRLGAYSTRTTHPFYMARWNELLSLLSIPAQLANPYQCMTKGEMILNSSNIDLVSQTVSSTISCSSVAKARWAGHAPGHCGYCYPCLIRRAAERAGLGKEVTSYDQLPDLTRTVVRASAIGEHLWSLRYIAEKLAIRPADARAFVNKTGPLRDYAPAQREAFAEVFRRGIAEVDSATRKIQFA